MRLHTVFWSLASAAAASVTLLCLIACGAAAPRASADSVPPRERTAGASTGSAPLILAAEEGERRVRRLLGGAPLIIKVDHRNGGAPDFVMGY
jgi:hypothetical protein